MNLVTTMSKALVLKNLFNNFHPLWVVLLAIIILPSLADSVITSKSLSSHESSFTSLSLQGDGEALSRSKRSAKKTKLLNKLPADDDDEGDDDEGDDDDYEDVQPRKKAKHYVVKNKKGRKGKKAPGQFKGFKGFKGFKKPRKAARNDDTEDYQSNEASGSGSGSGSPEVERRHKKKSRKSKKHSRGRKHHGGKKRVLTRDDVVGYRAGAMKDTQDGDPYWVEKEALANFPGRPIDGDSMEIARPPFNTDWPVPVSSYPFTHEYWPHGDK